MNNLLTDKTDIAKALNFGKYPVLTFNLDTKEGSKARVRRTSYNGRESLVNVTLNRDYEKEGDGIFYLSHSGTMLKAHYGWVDHLKSAEFANAPIIESDQDVAILNYSEKLDISFVIILNSGKVDGQYSDAARFTYQGE